MIDAGHAFSGGMLGCQTGSSVLLSFASYIGSVILLIAYVSVSLSNNGQ